MIWQSFQELRPLLMFVASIAAVWAVASLAARPYQWLARARHFLNVLDIARIRGVEPEGVLIKLADREEGTWDCSCTCWLVGCDRA